MKRLKEYADEGSPLNEQSNYGKEPVKEEITNNSSELLQTVEELRTEMEIVKNKNERILRAQEELNQILMEKFQSEGKDKPIGFENTSYQHKSKNSKHSKIESSSSSEIYGDSHRNNHQYSSDSSKDNYQSRKIKYKPYEDILGEFKKIKPPTFNGEIEKGEESKVWNEEVFSNI